VVFKHLSDPLPRAGASVPGLPESVEKVLIKALAKKPEDRYADMGAFEKALEGISLAAGQGQSSAAVQPADTPLAWMENQATLDEIPTQVEPAPVPLRMEYVPPAAPIATPPSAILKYWPVAVILLVTLALVGWLARGGLAVLAPQATATATLTATLPATATPTVRLTLTPRPSSTP